MPTSGGFVGGSNVEVGDITVSSITDPVTVSSITDPVTVQGTLTTVHEARASDAFGRFRVALPNMLIGTSYDYARGAGSQARALKLAQATSNGSVTLNANAASRTLAITNVAAGSYAIEQTREYSTYRAG